MSNANPSGRVLKLSSIVSALMVASFMTFSYPSVAFASGPKPIPRLASENWSASAPVNSVAKLATNEDVDAFLKTYLPQDYRGVAGRLCSFSFADLRGNGVLSLVASTGSVGRSSCAIVYIIDKGKDNFEIFTTSVAVGAGGDMASSIMDLDHDGRSELVLDQPIAKSADCYANFPVIYARTGNGYSNVSSRFKDYYEKTLELLRTKIKLNQTSEAADKEIECQRAEASKIERFLGASANAGIDQAIRLSTSSLDPDRAFAVELFGNLATPEALKYLKVLSHDPSNDVSFTAKAYLTGLAMIPVHPNAEPTFQRVP